MSLWAQNELVTTTKINQKELFVGAAAPSEIYDGQLWYDTTNLVHKGRRSGAWVSFVYTDARQVVDLGHGSAIKGAQTNGNGGIGFDVLNEQSNDGRFRFRYGEDSGIAYISGNGMSADIGTRGSNFTLDYTARDGLIMLWGMAASSANTVWEINRASAGANPRTPYTLIRVDGDSKFYVGGSGGHVRQFLQVDAAGTPYLGDTAISLSVQTNLVFNGTHSISSLRFGNQVNADGQSITNLVGILSPTNNVIDIQSQRNNGALSEAIRFYVRNGADNGNILVARIFGNSDSPYWEFNKDVSIVSNKLKTSNFDYYETGGVLVHEHRTAGSAMEYGFQGRVTTATNRVTRLAVVGKGRYAVDGNWEHLYLESFYEDNFALNISTGGTGTLRPFRIQMNGSTALQINTNKTSLFYEDIEIQVADARMLVNAISGDPLYDLYENGSARWRVAYSTGGNYLYIRDIQNARDLIQLHDSNLIGFLTDVRLANNTKFYNSNSSNFYIIWDTANDLNFAKPRDGTNATKYNFADVGGLSGDANGGGFWRGLHLSSPTVTVSSTSRFPRMSMFWEFNSLTDPSTKKFVFEWGNSSSTVIPEVYFQTEAGALMSFDASRIMTVNNTLRLEAQNPALAWMGDVDEAQWLTSLGGYYLTFKSDNADTGALDTDTTSYASRTFRPKVRFTKEGGIFAAWHIRAYRGSSPYTKYVGISHDDSNGIVESSSGHLVLKAGTTVVRGYDNNTYDLGSASFNWLNVHARYYNVKDYIDFTRITDPGNPATDYARMYNKQIDSNNDGLFVRIKKAGAFVELQVA